MLSLDFHLIIAQVVTFLIGLFLLWKIAYRPLLAVFQQRADKIKNDLDAAEKARQDMEAAKVNYQQEMTSLEQKARELFQKAAQEGQATREALINEARTQSQDLLQRAQERIAIEKDKALKELRQEAVTLAMGMTEKVLKTAVTPEVQHRLVDQVFQQMEGKDMHAGR